MTSILTILVASNLIAAEVDLSKSSFKWSATKKIGDGHHGEVALQSASIKMNGEEIVGGEFVIDMSSITVADLSGEWQTKFLNHVKNEDFFQIEKYPTATFVIEREGNGFLYGQLTIKGKSDGLAVPFEKSGNAYTAEMAFDRTKFDMTYGSDSFFKNLGDKVINDEVKVAITVVLKE